MVPFDLAWEELVIQRAGPSGHFLRPNVRRSHAQGYAGGG